MTFKLPESSSMWLRSEMTAFMCQNSLSTTSTTLLASDKRCKRMRWRFVSSSDLVINNIHGIVRKRSRELHKEPPPSDIDAADRAILSTLYEYSGYCPAMICKPTKPQEHREKETDGKVGHWEPLPLHERVLRFLQPGCQHGVINVLVTFVRLVVQLLRHTV